MDAMTNSNTTLVKRALDAQEEYAAAMKEEGTGREHAIAAVIAYGEALLEGREEYAHSNKQFMAWVTDNRLDQGEPWSKRKERTAAMAIARIARETGRSSFEGCSRSRPNDIIGWYRKQHPKPKTDAQLKREAGAKAKRAQQQELALSGDEDQQLARAEFSDKSKMTIDRAVAIHKKRLDKAFWNTVQEEVHKAIAKADDAVRKSYDELRPRFARLEQRYAQLQQAKGVFTKAEFRQLQMAVHPDNTAGPEVRNRLLDLLVKNEAKLVKEV